MKRALNLVQELLQRDLPWVTDIKTLMMVGSATVFPWQQGVPTVVQRNARLRVVSELVGRPVTSTNDLLTNEMEALKMAFENESTAEEIRSCWLQTIGEINVERETEF